MESVSWLGGWNVLACTNSQHSQSFRASVSVAAAVAAVTVRFHHTQILHSNSLIRWKPHQTNEYDSDSDFPQKLKNAFQNLSTFRTNNALNANYRVEAGQISNGTHTKFYRRIICIRDVAKLKTDHGENRTATPFVGIRTVFISFFYSKFFSLIDSDQTKNLTISHPKKASILLNAQFCTLNHSQMQLNRLVGRNVVLLHRIITAVECCPCIFVPHLSPTDKVISPFFHSPMFQTHKKVA